jgi:hypothetical protein
MAKVIIKLDLRRENDLRDYNLYNNAGGMFDALFEISCNLKKKISYKYDSDCEDILDLVFEQIAEILEENNVIIDKLS